MYNNLYKGRYMIALYDQNDRLISVFLNVREACESYRLNFDNMRSQIGRLFSGKISHTNLFGKKMKVCFIDCFPQNDQFYDEDIKFLQEFGQRTTNKAQAQKLGIDIKTYYKRKKNGQIKENFEMYKNTQELGL